MPEEEKIETIAVTSEPDKIPDSWLWFKGSDGNASVTTTFATIAFFIVTLSYILSMFEKIGPLTFRQFDVAACAAYFTPLMALYFGRRWTEANSKK